MLLRRLLCRLFSPVALQSITRRMAEFRRSFLEFSRDTFRGFGSWGKSRELSLKASGDTKLTARRRENRHRFTRRQPHNLCWSKLAGGRLIFRLASSSATWRKLLRWLARHGIPTSERKVKSLLGSLFCRNVAWRETQFLSTGRQ